MQLTMRDVTKFLDVSESTVTRWIKQRGLPAQHVGGQYRFNRAELLEWATANQVKVSLELFDHLEADANRSRPWPRRWKRVASSMGSRTPTRTAPCAWSEFCRFPTASTGSCSCGSSLPGKLRPRPPSATASPSPTCAIRSSCTCRGRRSRSPFSNGRSISGRWTASRSTSCFPSSARRTGVTCNCSRGCPSPCTTASFGRAVIRQARAKEILREVRRVEAGMGACRRAVEERRQVAWMSCSPRSLSRCWPESQPLLCSKWPARGDRSGSRRSRAGLSGRIGPDAARPARRRAGVPAPDLGRFARGLLRWRWTP